ncbi:lysophospholipid transporter LplT [Paenibacillus psychroresistens]|uniref:Lysophospholipid transporter LplT n=1 Tax=Paenibacillus psychroresistens TaxID=1778678 RepID=A0A6B8RF75_9BACL|nr:lysophospholipid transporter LplT [Paenibacillus psychroresistens]QGQ94078.1 lysophospholipid transporter LplT [Paenibacillus psychroresistens]
MADSRKILTPLRSVYFTQFLSSFADNLNFFIIVGMVSRHGFANENAYITNIQIAFLLAYVILAPIVGAYADKTAKSHVLLVGNLFKSIGVGLLFFGLNPIICYMILGIGAVIYSPGKYGILTELTDNEGDLLRANAMIEGSAIIAIVFGTVAGGILAGISDFAGILTCFIFYLTSLAFTFKIPKKSGNPNIRYIQGSLAFFKDLRSLLAYRQARFSLIGTAAFWMTSAILRIALLKWLIDYLDITDTMNQSIILGTVGLGVVFAAAVTAKLVPVGKLHNAYLFGFLMVAAILLAALLPQIVFAIFMLFAMGFFGGLFLIPLNTILQEVGKNVVGAGKTIAIQNFVENGLTVSGLIVYTVLASYNVDIKLSIVVVAVILLLFVSYLATQVGKVRKESDSL